MVVPLNFQLKHFMETNEITTKQTESFSKSAKEIVEQGIKYVQIRPKGSSVSICDFGTGKSLHLKCNIVFNKYQLAKSFGI